MSEPWAIVCCLYFVCAALTAAWRDDDGWAMAFVGAALVVAAVWL